MEVSHPPMSVVISDCPKKGPCPGQRLRQTQIPSSHHAEYAEQQHDGAGPEDMEEKDKQNLGPAQVTTLLNKQNSKGCSSELTVTS